MIPLYTEEEYINSKSMDKLPCQCEKCFNIFYKHKKYITHNILNNLDDIKYCSRKCQRTTLNKSSVVNCFQCNKEFNKKLSQVKKSNNHFCSRSCAVTYRNTHKSTGTRRSKLEIWLEEQLSLLYPNLIFDFNRKDAINSELDIYIPSLKLAFELNGIFHYEPIYGSDKLNQIQNNDNRKFQACIENSIELCIIDTSSLVNFKPLKAKKYLDIIVNIINQRTYC